MDTSRIAPHAMPEPPSPIVGRERDLSSLSELLLDDGVRLLTLTGPGGVGKTRLALELANRIADRFEDGARLVELASLDDANMVLPAIARALHVPERNHHPPIDIVVTMLRDRHALLVLDNVEHVLDAAHHIAELVAWCPRLTILATGRSPFELRAEREYAVEPLDLPAPGAAMDLDPATAPAAVALFVERARSANPRFALTGANSSAVAEICRRVDGLPLAIELAATQLQLLEPAALLARLDRRLPMVDRGSRDLPARQRTMEQTVAWSHDLLSRDAQELFRRLAVFTTSFSLDAAVAVAPSGDGPATEIDVLNGMSTLVSHSLLRRGDDLDGEPRFAMLEATRTHALSRLAASGDADAVCRRHAEHYIRLAEDAEPVLHGSESVACLNRLEAEHGNLREALSWLLRAGETLLALRLAAALGRFWYVRGYLSEGRAWLERALAASPEADTMERVAALGALAALVDAQGDTRYQAQLADDALALARAAGDALDIARTLHLRGNVAQQRGAFAEATDLYEEALDLFRDADDQAGIAGVLNNLGLVAAEQRDCERSRSLLEDALTAYRHLGNQRGMAIALCNLGHRVVTLDGPSAAIPCYQEALLLFQAIGDQAGLAWGLHALAEAISEPAPATAARLLGGAEALREAIGWSFSARERISYGHTVALLRERMTPDEIEGAWDAGRSMSIERMLEEAASIAIAPMPKTPRVASPAQMPAGLSAREGEILRLVAAGLTNSQIACQLHLSPHTIDTHLRRIYRKAGIRSRSAATRFAIEQHLA